MTNPYVLAYTANGMLDAEMIRSFLETASIPCVLSHESAGTVFGLTLGPLGEVQVLVPADKLEEAKNILDEMDRGMYNQADDSEIEPSEGDQSGTKIE
ncbi:MAG: DUF2007 domain-containing protein [Anaerolineaceae bacterium]|nr:DUF2007 domain-containing protein [Anaerolineaceae bacterium]